MEKNVRKNVRKKFDDKNKKQHRLKWIQIYLDFNVYYHFSYKRYEFCYLFCAYFYLHASCMYLPEAVFICPKFRVS